MCDFAIPKIEKFDSSIYFGLLSKGSGTSTFFYSIVSAQSMRRRLKLCGRSKIRSALSDGKSFNRFESFAQKCTPTVDLMALRQLLEHCVTSETPTLWRFRYRIDEKENKSRNGKKKPASTKKKDKRKTQTEHKRMDGQKKVSEKYVNNKTKMKRREENYL